MASLSSLAPSQRAVLSLILEKGKTFAEIAALLQIDEQAVRERAHLALDALAPAGGAKPAARHRAAIGNYLLGQDDDRDPATFAYLETSVAGRAWARALAGELVPLAGGRLPEIPPDPDRLPVETPPEPGAAVADLPPLPPEPGPQTQPSPPAGPTPAARPATPAVSRRGGALLILGALAAVAAVVAAVLVFTGGSSPHRTPAATKPAAKLAAQITLTAPRGTRAQGLAAIIQRGGERIIAIAAAKLRPTSAHLAYGAWLYNGPADFLLIGFVPAVTADGKISAAAQVPAGAAHFHTLLLTREANRQATRPGTAVLSGPVPAAALG